MNNVTQGSKKHCVRAVSEPQIAGRFMAEQKDRERERDRERDRERKETRLTQSVEACRFQKTPPEQAPGPYRFEKRLSQNTCFLQVPAGSRRLPQNKLHVPTGSRRDSPRKIEIYQVPAGSGPSDTCRPMSETLDIFL